MRLKMKLKDKIKQAIRESNYNINTKNMGSIGDIAQKDKEAVYHVGEKDLDAVSDEIKKEDPEGLIVPKVDESEVQTDPIDEKCDVLDNDFDEAMSKSIGESVKPKMTKNQLVETILKTGTKKVVKKFKVKDILK